jgi:tRNA (cmo5U34)-methyltransferase
LCVGVGTGSELIDLANAFPNWRFTAVDPAKAMIDICQKRTNQLGLSSRCTFHHGYLDSLPDTTRFSAATSILVSHFITNENERIEYYSEIASRLLPDSYLVNADLATDMSSDSYKILLDPWVKMHEYANMLVNVNKFGNDVALVPVNEIESLLKTSGFEEPVLFFQTIFLHAWFSKLRAIR